MNVLILDNCEINNIILSFMLHKIEHNIHIKHSINTNNINNKNYDIIFTNTNLNLNINNLKYLCKGPIIGISSFTDNKSISEFLNSGLDYILTAPYNKKILQEIINKQKSTTKTLILN